jgi:hypothetical protein
LIDLEADTCSGCGQPLSETLLAEAYQGYRSDPPAVCHGCKALVSRQKDHAEEDDLPALRFTVRRVWEEADPDG